MTLPLLCNLCIMYIVLPAIIYVFHSKLQFDVESCLAAVQVLQWVHFNSIHNLSKIRSSLRIQRWGCNECKALGLVVKSDEKCTFMDASQLHCCTQTVIILNVLDKAMMPYLYTAKHIQRRFLSLGNPKSFKEGMKSKSNAKANEVSSLGSVCITWPGSLVISIPYWRFTFGRHLALKASSIPAVSRWIHEFKKVYRFLNQNRSNVAKLIKHCNLRCWCRWCQGHLPLNETMHKCWTRERWKLHFTSYLQHCSIQKVKQPMDKEQTMA